MHLVFFFFFQAEDGIRDYKVTGVQTCALPILTRMIARGQRSAMSATFASQRLEQLRVTGCASRSSGTDLLLRSGVPIDSASWRWVDAGNSHYRLILRHTYRTQQNAWRQDSLETEISCLF